MSIDHVSDIFAHAGRIQETTRRYLEKRPSSLPLRRDRGLASTPAEQ